MTNPGGLPFDEDAPEADAVEQQTPVESDDDRDTWTEASRITTAREWDANEADLIEQALEVPEDDTEFDR